MAEDNVVSSLSFLAGLMSLSAHSGSGENGFGENTAGKICGLLKVTRDVLFKALYSLSFFSPEQNAFAFHPATVELLHSLESTSRNPLPD